MRPASVAQVERWLERLAIDLEVALGELVPLPLGIEAQPVVDVVDELARGNEDVRLVGLELLDAEGAKSAPIVRLGERLAAEVGRRAACRGRSCVNEIVSSAVVSDELLREDVRVLADVRRRSR